MSRQRAVFGPTGPVPDTSRACTSGARGDGFPSRERACPVRDSQAVPVDRQSSSKSCPRESACAGRPRGGALSPYWRGSVISCDTGVTVQKEPFEEARRHRLTPVGEREWRARGGPRRPCCSDREAHRRFPQVTEWGGVKHTWNDAAPRHSHKGSDLKAFIASSDDYGSEGWGFESSRVRHLETVEKPPGL